MNGQFQSVLCLMFKRERENNCYRQNYQEATNFGVEVMKYFSTNNEITNFPSLFNTMSFRF